jgi:LPS sulfotransferase NodH
MKILVLSHTRCGSTTLCKWISKELGYELDETPYERKYFNEVFEKDNIIRKIVVEEYFPTKKEINKFDKVICLSRDNSIDSAISFVYANTIGKWHIEYKITEEWINENKNEILKQIFKYDSLKIRLKAFEGIHITYDGVYIKKTAINEILKYVEIDSAKHLEILCYDKKYRKDCNSFIKKYSGII